MSKASPAGEMRVLIDAVDRGDATGPGFAGPDAGGLFAARWQAPRPRQRRAWR
jgi:hypothetical protein